MLETIREYASERLEESREGKELRRRHAASVLTLAEEAEPHIVGVSQREWLARLDADRDNIRAALAWAFDVAPALGLQLAAALGRFWWVRGAAEGLGWLNRGLVEEEVPADLRAVALDAAGGAAWFPGDSERALALFEQGLTVCRDLGDRAGVARMLARLGPPLMQLGRIEEAERAVEESVAINRELRQTRELALALSVSPAPPSSAGSCGVRASS
jgi:tetratricopeptide (TPR) repeat protein